MVHAGCDCRPKPLQLKVADNETQFGWLYGYNITSLPFSSFKIRNGWQHTITLMTIRRRVTIVMIRILLILSSDHDACYCDGHGQCRSCCGGMAEAPDTNGEQCSVREQLLRAQTRLQEMQALPDSTGHTKSSALSSKEA